ncbi:unnamed protein product [Ambrosiozyma monospora]|uniref:Unnamed protein product n=1 Tax=Ambrosiozyma monospora TaxID=43982 RepID=A0ACB5SWP9_AMBMO|nr:unnamed protein product [Ambrosiozyma monospora]
MAKIHQDFKRERAPPDKESGFWIQGPSMARFKNSGFSEIGIHDRENEKLVHSHQSQFCRSSRLTQSSPYPILGPWVPYEFDERSLRTHVLVSKSDKLQQSIPFPCLGKEISIPIQHVYKYPECSIGCFIQTYSNSKKA